MTTAPSPRISVIVPLYNVREYLADCICSICRQSLTPHEIILVDDGSTDGSMAEADRVLEAYPGIRVLRFTHSPNRGVAAARNTGMDAASGDYILFVDSDDCLTPDCLHRLSEPLRQKQWDIVVGDYQVTGSDSYYPPLRGKEGPLEGNKAIRKAYRKGLWYAMVWNKLYRTEYLRREGIRFAEGFIIEDEGFSIQTALTARSMYIVKAITYLYKIRKGSLTTGDHLEERLDSWVEILQRTRKAIQKQGLELDFSANWLLQKFFIHAVEASAPKGKEAFLEYYYRLRNLFPDGRFRFLLASHGHLGRIRKDLHWILPQRLAGRRVLRRYLRHHPPFWAG